MLKTIFTLSFANFIFSLFVLFTIVVKESSLLKFNTDVTMLVQSKADHYLDTLFSWVSTIGRIEVSLVFLLILLFIIKKQHRITVVLLFGMMQGIEVFCKLSIQQKGPPFQFYRHQIEGSLLDSYIAPGYSYPSGHAMRVTVIAFIILYTVIKSEKLSFIQKNIIVSSILPIVILLFISKIYLGEHWISDIVGGILLGLTFNLFGYTLLRRFNWN